MRISVERAEEDTGTPQAPLHWFALPAALAIALLVLDQTTDLDRAITRLVYGAAGAGFALRTNFWLDVVMHHWTEYAVVTLACLAIGALLLSYALPGLAAHRRTLRFMALALAVAPLVVLAGKAVSTRHCPWDVDEFGGLVPYERLIGPIAPNVKPGHCFPAGHASTGFVLMAFYFAAYSRGLRRAALAALTLGITAGLVLGFGRVLQGAHFMSHVLWSGLLCWMVMLLLYIVCLQDAPSGEMPAATPDPGDAR